jgi:hypothetical protein
MLIEKDLIQISELKFEIIILEEEIADLEEELEETNERIMYVSPMQALEESQIILPDAIHIGAAKTGANPDRIINFIINLEKDKNELLRKISYLKIEKLEKEDRLNKILKSIKNIKDENLRKIIKLRHIDKLTWTKVGEKVHLTRQAAQKKYKNWLQNSFQK